MVEISSKSIFVPPKSDNFFEGMRQGVGYSFVTALADIIDNSLTAGASKIHIVTDPNSTSLSIIDDGIGMNNEELLNAMTVSSANPNEARANRDLGRYGLGLKLASLSQCDSLSVFSFKKGQGNGYKWDLSHLQANNWELLILDDPENAPHSELIEESGTIVIWEDIRIGQSAKNPNSKSMEFNKMIQDARNHLSLTFHRFISGEPGIKKCKITINGSDLIPIDPFNQNSNATVIEKEEFIGPNVSYQVFTLPHADKYENDAEYQKFSSPGGKGTYRDNQGFYIYRGARLISHGSWLRLAPNNPLTQLTRVKVDINNKVDEEWEIQLHKSHATFPPHVREVFVDLIQRLQSSSRKVYSKKGEIITSKANLNGWNRVVTNNKISYEINQSNPIFKSYLENVPSNSHKTFLELIRFLQESVPVNSIFTDMGSSPRKLDANSEPNDFEKWVLFSFDAAFDQTKDKLQAFHQLEQAGEPYASQIDEIRLILDKYRNFSEK